MTLLRTPLSPPSSALSDIGIITVMADSGRASNVQPEANMDNTEPQIHAGIVNRSAPTATVVPVLIYDDVGKAIDWLCGAFGFTERLRAVGRDGSIGHAQLAVAEGAIMLGRQGGGFRPPRPNEVNQYVHVSVEDVDRHFDHAKQFGARIVGPPTDK